MISDIDISDWEYEGKTYEKTQQVVPLYEAPRNCLVSFAEDNLSTSTCIPFKFNKIDGAYSLCMLLHPSFKGEVFHPAAWTKVFLWKESMK
jgi:hypothetical protein